MTRAKPPRLARRWRPAICGCRSNHRCPSSPVNRESCQARRVRKRPRTGKASRDPLFQARINSRYRPSYDARRTDVFAPGTKQIRPLLGLTRPSPSPWRKTMWFARNKAKQRVISYDSGTLLDISWRWSHRYGNWVLRKISRSGGDPGQRPTEGEGAVRMLWGRRSAPLLACGDNWVGVGRIVRTAGCVCEG